MGPFGPALVLGCRIVLAGVLGVAAVTKIADRHELPARLRAMGVRAPWDARLAIALPVAELAVAVALLAAPDSTVPAFAAIVLLVAFSGFLVATARRAVPCPCFGAVSREKASTVSGAIVRNGFLIALAVIGTGSTTGARAGATAIVVLVSAAVAALVVTRVA